MTEEERQLLLTALCGYLPYKVKCFAEDREYGDLGTLYSVDPFENLDPNIYIQYDKGNVISFFTSEIKPYLRPISSMTEDERKDIHQTAFCNPKYGKYFILTENGIIYNGHNNCCCFSIDSLEMVVDWLNVHHFDYRGLIPKGLAIEAPKDMYN